MSLTISMRHQIGHLGKLRGRPRFQRHISSIDCESSVTNVPIDPSTLVQNAGLLKLYVIADPTTRKLAYIFSSKDQGPSGTVLKGLSIFGSETIPNDITDKS